MAATSLKLPEGLKRRIERLAGAANKTPHAFMVDVLSQEADRAELRERFAADAAVSENETMEGGKAVALGAAFDHLEARVAGESARRPRERAWRAASLAHSLHPFGRSCHGCSPKCNALREVNKARHE
jgi:predicted transcriptional regulator